ncbi:MAG: TetR/AcrR family transcriptional regulator [Candidatus Methanomethylophilaceae archaeon]|nr:TetR/AcrR family transcriptional regulator [Candidatus Methanomethylophilaceae archaeon]MDD3378954.1 TetR/AcrR family transcriptional regulator [Candidatus Methanomethylophilaceae archaeon]MDY0224227.1 TetR/AcrR family transcriptional regulator [Candidatus Methanomethylophilaceae archaeon]
MDLKFKRARSKENKEKRFSDILDVSVELYDKLRYPGLTFEEISKRLNITRPAIYKYFKTKDEILVEILLRDFSRLCDDLLDNFNPSVEYTKEEVAALWTDVMMKNKRVMDVLSLHSSSIEKMISAEYNSGPESIIKKYIEILKELTKRLIPGIDDDTAVDFILYQISFAVGLYPFMKIKMNDSDPNKEIFRFNRIYRENILIKLESMN